MVFRGRKSVLKKEQMARQKTKAGGRGNIWRASRCSHSACRSSRPGQSDLSNIGTLWSPGGVNKAHKHRDSTPSQRHNAALVALQRQPQSGRLFGSRKNRPVTAARAGRQPAGCACRTSRPPSPITAPANGRPALAAELRATRQLLGRKALTALSASCSAAALRPITNRNPVGGSLSVSADPLRLA